jgi:riboflavin transporter
LGTTTPSAVERYGVLAVRYFFGGHALASGLNHYLTFVPDIMPRGPAIAVTFMGVLLQTHLYDMVKVMEILCGLSLLTGLFMPLALAMEMPVSIIVCFLSLFIAPTARSIYTGPREVVMNGFLLTMYWGYFRPVFFAPQPAMIPFWRRAPSGTGEAA